MVQAAAERTHGRGCNPSAYAERGVATKTGAPIVHPVQQRVKVGALAGVTAVARRARGEHGGRGLPDLDLDGGATILRLAAEISARLRSGDVCAGLGIVGDGKRELHQR
jgi:hypothetical protein